MGHGHSGLSWNFKSSIADIKSQGFCFVQVIENQGFLFIALIFCFHLLKCNFSVPLFKLNCFTPVFLWFGYFQLHFIYTFYTLTNSNAVIRL